MKRPAHRKIDPQHPEWPSRLDELGGARAVQELFVAGRPLDVAAAIAVVGTRRPTVAGVEAAERFAWAFAEAGFAVVSGLALGIDAVAHRAALDAGGNTVAVLGCGLDIDYPAANRTLRDRILQSGTLVTEYRAGTQPTTYTFPERNRIIAGLAQAVVVVEGGDRSGALITARYALDANRSVFAVPGSIRNPMAIGPNQLIRTCQASLVTEPQQVFDELAPQLAWQQPLDLSAPVPSVHEEDVAVLALLDDVPLALDALCTRLGLPPAKVALSLARLETQGLAVKGYGGYEISRTGAGARAAVGGEAGGLIKELGAARWGDDEA